MNSRQQTQKLQELRSKTDRQLIDFLSHRLDFALQSSQLAAQLESGGNWNSAQACRTAADKAYAEVRALLPFTGSASSLDCRRLESQLQSIRYLLKEFTVPKCA